MVSLFILVTNAGGILGVIAGGRMADSRSRHLVAGIGLVGLAVGNTVMFAFAGLPMWLGSAVGSIVGGATIPALGVLNPELFPTSRRGAGQRAPQPRRGRRQRARPAAGAAARGPVGLRADDRACWRSARCW